MRFMVIVKADKKSEAGVLPDEKVLAAMGKFNEELTRAGVLVDLGGLQASSRGARVRFTGSRRTVIDGPFAETKELIAGYWILQTRSLAECIEWVKRCPNPDNGESADMPFEIEIRPFFELNDFEMTDTTKATHEKVAATLESKG